MLLLAQHWSWVFLSNMKYVCTVLTRCLPSFFLLNMQYKSNLKPHIWKECALRKQTLPQTKPVLVCSHGNQTYSLRAHTHTTVLSLTLYPDLPAVAVRAGQQGKLFRLVHGVVCAGNYNLIPGSPGLLHFILQVQHHLVHSIHLEAWDGETWGGIAL